LAASKTYIEGIGEIVIVRRRGLKNISLRVNHSGVIRLNLPWFVPKTTGLIFVIKKRGWLKRQMPIQTIWTDGHELFGKTLNITETDKAKTSWKFDDNTLSIIIPKSYGEDKKQVKIGQILDSFLKLKTEEVIAPKVRELAARHSFKLNSVSVKKLKSRWGSCDHKGNIKLSLYLYTLPEALWTYVVCHELAHLDQLNHSPKFWQEVGQLDPNYKLRRKQLRLFKPNI